MEDFLRRVFERQEEIIASIHRLEMRLELNERAVKSIDEQLAQLNINRQAELKDLQPTLEELKRLEEFLRLDIAGRFMDSIEESVR